MTVITVFNDITLAKDAAVSKTINLTNEEIPGLWNDTGALPVYPIAIQAEFTGTTGGSITITATWSISGKTQVAQAFLDGAGDVSAIVEGTGTCWDVLLLPVKPGSITITVTEDDIATITGLDLFLSY